LWHFVQWALKNAEMLGVSSRWVPPFGVVSSGKVAFGSLPKPNPLAEKRTMEIIRAKFTLLHIRSGADLRQAKALYLIAKFNFA